MTMAIHARQAAEGAKLSPYDHNENNAPKLKSTTSALFGVALFLVMVRGYVRVIMTKTMGKDDWAMLLSMVRTPFNIVVPIWGIGLHRASDHKYWSREPFPGR